MTIHPDYPVVTPADYPTHVLEELELPIIEDAARRAKAALDLIGFASVELQPGDGTRYIVAVLRQTELNCTELWGTDTPYLVATQYSGLYPWRGEPSIHHSYATEKWGGHERSTWTGAVMGIFLNYLAIEIHRP